MNRALLFLLFLTVNSYGQLTEEQLVSRALEQLEISEKDVFKNLLASGNFGSETILAIPVVSEEGDGYIVFDAYLVLAENATGKIVSKYFGQNEWSSDAVRLLEINIDPKIYELGGHKEAFGVIISYEGNSMPNPYSSTKLSLYEKAGNDLKPVLQDFEIKYHGGETDTNCNGTFETRTKSMETSDSETEGYADLNFIVEIEKSTLTDNNCESTVVETREETEVLKFSDGKYQ